MSQSTKFIRSICIDEGFDFGSNKPYKYLQIRVGDLDALLETNRTTFIAYTYDLLNENTKEINRKLEEDLIKSDQEVVSLKDLGPKGEYLEFLVLDKRQEDE